MVNCNKVVRSRHKFWYIIWFIFLLINTLFLLFSIYKIIERANVIGLTRTITLVLFFGTLTYLIIFCILKDYKYIKIDNQHKIIIWYSLLVPWGKRVNFSDYKAKVVVTEITRYSSYPTAYLLNDTLTTRIKINGLFYKNFGKLFNALEVDEIKDHYINFWKYLKLLFTGRLKIRPKANKKRCIDSDINSLLRKSLESYKELNSPQTGVFHPDNMYNRPPYFIFRFKNPKPEDYLAVENIINSYNGLLKWSLTKAQSSKHALYHIEPYIIMKLRHKKGKSLEDIMNIIEEDIYDICDKSLKDIKHLSEVLKNELNNSKL